jgi:transglutaminase-like putative cysteine protease
MDKKRPQLSVDELRQLRWLLGGLLILLSVSTVVYLEIDAWLLALCAVAAVTVALLRPGLPARVPPLAHRLAFPASVVYFAWDLYSNGELLPAAVRLDILLLMYRGISYRKKRDDLQIVVLGLFLVMAAGVLTVSLAFGVQILVFTGGTLAFLFVITVTEAAEAGVAGGADAARSPAAAGGGAARPPEWTGVRWSKLLRRLREVADWRLLWLAGGLFAGVVAVSALLFLAIPRFQLDSGFFLDRFISKQSRTGFSDSITLGDVVDIQEDNSVALRVDVSDPAHIPAVPYWRMVVLDEYREGRARTSTRLKNDLSRSSRPTAYLPGSPSTHLPPVVWTFYLESGVSRFLPVGVPFSRLQFREAQQVERHQQLWVFALRNEPVTMTAYRVEGMLTDGFIPDRIFGSAVWRAAEAQRVVRAGLRDSGDAARVHAVYPLTTLELPDRPEDVEALKREAGLLAAGNSGGAPEFAVRARRWLTDHHGYSLKVDLAAGNRDPVVAWMESDRPGHCELFATAFTLLARAAGYPTRIVTGFKGGDWNGYENYFMVRNSQAHAWCEIYDGSTGWIRVDPTDGSAPINAGPENAAGDSGVLTRRLDWTWGARLDAIRILWYRRIVSFDQRSQLALVSALKETTTTFGMAVRETMERLSSASLRWMRRPWSVRRAFGWLAGAVAVAAGIWLGWRRARAWWWRLGGLGTRHRTDPVRREAGRWLRRMGGRRRLEDDAGDIAVELQRLRYGARETWPEPRTVFRRARRAMRR